MKIIGKDLKQLQPKRISFGYLMIKKIKFKISIYFQRIFRSSIINIPAQQNQIPAGPIPYSIINPSVPTDNAQDISQRENFVQLPAESISNTLHKQTTRLPSTSNHIARHLINQRVNMETPPPPFETAVNFNPSPSSNVIRSAENTPSQNATIDPPPPYPGPPPGESSL